MQSHPLAITEHAPVNTTYAQLWRFFSRGTHSARVIYARHFILLFIAVMIRQPFERSDNSYDWLTRNLETFKVITWAIKRETNVKKMLVNAERVNPANARASRNEEMQERIPGNPANRLHNDRETSGKLYSAERRPRASSCKLWGESKRAQNMAFWPRKGKASSFVIEAHRASYKTTEIQRRRRYAIHRARRTYGIYLLGMESRYFARVLFTARESCASNSALLAKEVDNVSREIIISHRITREKIYFVRVRMCACVCVCVRCTESHFCNREYRWLVIVACIATLIFFFVRSERLIERAMNFICAFFFSLAILMYFLFNVSGGYIYTAV